jgi:hypothetical protein
MQPHPDLTPKTMSSYDAADLERATPVRERIDHPAALASVQNVELDPMPGLAGGSGHHRPDRLRRAAILANDLAYVVLGYAQL